MEVEVALIFKFKSKYLSFVKAQIKIESKRYRFLTVAISIDTYETK